MALHKLAAARSLADMVETSEKAREFYFLLQDSLRLFKECSMNIYG